MFKKNNGHFQPDLFGLLNSLPKKMQDKAKQSEEYQFYLFIFCHIKEIIFKNLYSDKKSRPNAPINSMVAALILMSRYGWTYEQLFKNLQFNILFRIALGLDCLDEMPFCEATVHEFTCRMPKGKLKVRGYFKASLFAFTVAMSVNFGRIYRYILGNPDMVVQIPGYFVQIFKERFICIQLFVMKIIYSVKSNYSLPFFA